MAEEGKILFADDDWKEQARKEKERLAAQETAARPESIPPAGFADVLNLIAIQAMVGLGMVSGPGGERIPPSLDVARHFIDLLEVLQQKTKNNLTPEEQQVLDMVLYDLRLRYVEVMRAAAGAPPPPAAPQDARTPSK